jgi:type IV secretory pathway VirB10-like protein
LKEKIVKQHQTQLIKVAFFLILAFLLFACSREEPTPAPEEPTPSAEVEAQPAASEEETPQAEQPIANEPEASQPIYPPNDN